MGATITFDEIPLSNEDDEVESYSQPQTNIYNLGPDKNLATYNQFLDEIEKVTKIVVQQSFKTYANIEYVNKYNLSKIKEHYEFYKSFLTNDWFLENLSNKDLSAFVDTAYEYNMVTNEQRDLILQDRDKFFELIPEDSLNILIDVQDNLKAYLPDPDDLFFVNNIKQIFKNLLESGSEFLEFDNDQVKEVVSDTLHTMYQQYNFISSYKAEKLFEKPYKFFEILDYMEIELLIKRVKPFLIFLTDKRIQDILNFKKDPMSKEVIEVISNDEIKLMMDKDIDLKYNIFKLFTYEDLTKTLNNFKQELFKNDFKQLVEDAIIFNIYPDIEEEELCTWILKAINESNTPITPNT